MQGSILHLAVTQDLSFRSVQLPPPLHMAASSQIICSTSFFVQLLCCSLFLRISVSNQDVEDAMLQFDYMAWIIDTYCAFGVHDSSAQPKKRLSLAPVNLAIPGSCVHV